MKMSDALTFACVPPAKGCSVTAADEVWFRSVTTLPTSSCKIAWPVFCCVPAPDPYTVEGAGVPLTVNAN